MKTTLATLLLLFVCMNAGAQDKGAATTKNKKNGPSISIGSGGIRYENGTEDTGKQIFEIQFGMLDLGLNSLVDQSNYDPVTASSVQGNSFFQVPPDQINKSLFSLRQSKSININIYPILLKARLYQGKKQEFTLATGLGLQLYNFRFNKPVSYVSDPAPHVILDTVSFSKNKLALSYAMVPLMLNCKTRIGNVRHSRPGEGYWLSYGLGVSAGYLINSWTKQISDARGKEKNHDAFNLRKSNFCVNGEIGLDGFVRLYVSYQITALHEDALNQHPLSIGVRFLGL